MGAVGIRHAREYLEMGWAVLPAPKGGKLPQVQWKEFQDRLPTEGEIERWFGGPRRNYFLVTGRTSNVCVLDCDSPQAEAGWRETLGEAFDTTACVLTRNGRHLYFRLPEGARGDGVRGRAWHRDGVDWDFRCEGGGVILPPSVHESGHEYVWVEGRGPEALQEAPEALLRGGGPFGSLEAAPGAPEGQGGQVRSMLARLLAEPPQEGGRNDWLARVAGHYAKAHRNMRDLYDVECERANAMLARPLGRAEYTKTVESIWESEQRKVDGGVECGPDTGWLVSGGPEAATILCQVKRGKGDEVEYGLEEWANFDLQALGVVEDEDTERVYSVRLYRRLQGDQVERLLPAKVLADPRSLRTWLLQSGVSAIQPANAWPAVGGVSERLSRYLESQEPPKFRVAMHLGWEEGDGFICHEGVIRADGLHPFGDHRPHPTLANRAPYRYGFQGDRERAREILREVLQFHDPVVCAVFGAWWAACLLKPQISRSSSQFPFMALEAPSESGKTTGFFSLMRQLAGADGKALAPTMAMMRDAIGAHRSGIVWVDDLSDVQPLMDLLRQATGEGSVGKKGEDRTTQVVTHLVAPICISGESLQMHHQKALMDRAISLDVPSPTSRRSQRPGVDRLQWADIVELQNSHPEGLNVYAGHVVQMALAEAGQVERLPSLVPLVGGRFGDKIAILRLGARVLAAMVGEPEAETGGLVERVDAWCERVDDLGSENSLTTKILPEALAGTDWKTRPEAAQGRWPATPAFIHEGRIWFSPKSLAAWWSEMRHGRIEQRTESEEALIQQGHALGLGGLGGGDREMRRQWRLAGAGGTRQAYWAIPEDLSEIILARSRGESPAGTRRLQEECSRTPQTPEKPTGVHPEQYRLALWIDHDEDPE